MAVRKLVLCAILATCLTIVVPAWAGTLQFTGTDLAGQGSLSFTPGLNNLLTIGPGGGGQGALVQNLVNNLFICGGDCAITGGYMTLMSGGEATGTVGGGSFLYTFNGGGTIDIYGTIASHNINSALIFSATFLPGGVFTGAGSVGTYVASVNLGSIFLNPNLGTYKYSGGSNVDTSITINPGCSTGGACSGLIFNTNTTLQTIPEPATLSVLGAGLFAFGAGLRRKMLGT
jgi:PEP-CTERM motif